MRVSHFQGARRSDGDHGFTLIELVIAITLSLLIGGVVVAALITSLRVSSSTTDEVGDSTDAGLITAFLTRDAQSAGSIVPTTALRNTTVGVSTAATAWDSCSQAPAALVVRFSWIEWSSVQLVENKVVVTYGLASPDALNPTKKQLTRRLCRNGATTGADIVLARDLASVTATCTPACTTTTTTPTTMRLDVTSWGPTPLVYQLRASVRGDTQLAPTVANSAPVPLLALGAGSSVICPNVDLAGTGVVTVRGDVLVDKLCGAAPIKDDLALLRPTGTTRTIPGIVDPFLARVKPGFTCVATGVNPATVGTSASATTIVTYHQIVKITADTVFQAGRFVFCKGLEFTSGRITGANVLLYINAGSFEVKPEATVNLTGQTTTDKKMLVWSNQLNTPIKVAGGPRVSNYRGLIYAPTSKMEMSSMLGLNIEGINARGLTVTGAGQARIGGPIPTITFPSSPPAAGQANVAYSKTVSASGGTAAYTWSATGLPPGLSMSTTGVISGTPTTAGTSPVVVTVFDSTKASASIDYSLTINAALAVAATPTLPNGQVGVAYATTTLTPVGGTAPYSWTQTGLPAGLTISAAGAVSGTPTVSGSFAVTVTVTDAYTFAQRSYTVVIASSLVVAGPALPNGQINVAYGPATVTATGGTAPLTWTQTGLPAGLSIGAATGTVSGTPTAVGNYTVTVTVTDATSASAQATYPVSIAAAPTTVCPAYTTPWKGQYYSNINLSGTPVLLRDDASPNFDWGTSSPGAGVPVDNFSVRWTRTTDFGAGDHKFGLSTGDGGRLYVDGVLLINNWVDQDYPATPIMYTKNLTAGSHTIVVEFYEHLGSARVGLLTTLPGNGVTAVAGTCNDRTYFGESRITFSNSLPVTAMTVTIRIAQTAGVTFNGNYVTFEGGNVSISHITSGGFIVYTFTLDAGRTIVVGSWTIAAQWNGTGTLHATTNDTWSVVTTTSAGSATLSGNF